MCFVSCIGSPSGVPLPLQAKARVHTEIRQVTHSEEGRRLVTFRRVVQMLPISKQSAHERGLQLNTPIHFYYIDSSDCPPPTLVASACCGVIGAAGAFS